MKVSWRFRSPEGKSDWRQYPRAARDAMPAISQRPPLYYPPNFVPAPPMYVPPEQQPFPRDRFSPGDWRTLDREYNRRDYDRRPQ